MKSMKIPAFLSALLILLSSFASCAKKETTTEKLPSESAPVASVTTKEESETIAPTVTPVPTETPSEDDVDTITVAEAIALCTSETPTVERYYLKGTVKSITNPTYGEMILEDSTGTLKIYGTYSADGSQRYSELTEKPVAGDEVLLSVNLCTFNGEPEAKTGWIIRFTHKDPDFDKTAYTEMTVSAARDAEKGAKVAVSGVVAQIIYANGQKPCAFYLVDNTGSIYIYDNQVAPQVKIGNEVTVYGNKNYYISDSETSNAEKFGYKGCCQLENVYLTANKESGAPCDFSWVRETAVKELLNSDFSENSTTNIHKVNALVKKVEGKGFVNYYINDLDGETGSYVYTMCSGADFAWLDAFDGKICTVYLSLLNAKSTASGCVWRFLPVAVKDEGFTFDKNAVAEFVVNYHVIDLFKSEYTGDPELVLPTVLASTLLNFDGATVSYKSSDESIVYFETVDKNTVKMHTRGAGTATVTVTGAFNGKTFEKQLTVKNTAAVVVNGITVAQAYAAEMETSVTVTGIVGASLVNRSGFYLIDDTGAIAVTVSAEVLDTLELGQKVTVTGTRTNTVGEKLGQSCILDAVVEANYYGNNDYSSKSFREGTIAQIAALEKVYTNTETVYVVNAKVKKVETAYYTNYYLTDGENELLLYASSGSQYSWIEQYGEEIRVELAICNWNGKALRGALLSILLPDGSKVVNDLNFR